MWGHGGHLYLKITNSKMFYFLKTVSLILKPTQCLILFSVFYHYPRLSYMYSLWNYAVYSKAMCLDGFGVNSDRKTFSFWAK